MPSPWSPPSCEQSFTATVDIPGSKSMTNRALVLAALAAPDEGSSTLTGWLDARDTALMVHGLRALGTDIVAGDTMRVSAGRPTGTATIDCGLAGTVMRFLPPVAARATGDVRFRGDAQAGARPLAPMLNALRVLGADLDGDSLPFTIHGTGSLRGGSAAIDASASSQFVSGLLLSAATMREGLDLRHVGAPLPSQPHIDMTTAMLAEAGVGVEVGPDRWRIGPGPVHAHDWTIEPDLSNAGPFLAAAMVTASTVTVSRWPASTTQAGDYWRTFLAGLGADVRLGLSGPGPVTPARAESGAAAQVSDTGSDPSVTNPSPIVNTAAPGPTAGGLTVVGPASYPGFDADLRAVGELTPTIAALAAFACGPSRLTGIGHLRGHETDRLHAIATELTRVGVSVAIEPDGLRIDPAHRHATSEAVIETYADHRMATMGAILALRIRGLGVADAATTAKTMPDFVTRWEGMVA